MHRGPRRDFEWALWTMQFTWHPCLVRTGQAFGQERALGVAPHQLQHLAAGGGRRAAAASRERPSRCSNRNTVAGTARSAKASAIADIRPLLGVDVAATPLTSPDPADRRPRTPVRGGAQAVEPPLRITLLTQSAPPRHIARE